MLYHNFKGRKYASQSEWWEEGMLSIKGIALMPHSQTSSSSSTETTSGGNLITYVLQLTAINSSVDRVSSYSTFTYSHNYVHVHRVLLQDTSSPGNSAPQHHLWKRFANPLFYVCSKLPASYVAVQLLNLFPCTILNSVLLTMLLLQVLVGSFLMTLQRLWQSKTSH